MILLSVNFTDLQIFEVKADSFFNFFDPPPVPEDPTAEVDEDTQAFLTADFEIGHYIRLVYIFLTADFEIGHYIRLVYIFLTSDFKIGHYIRLVYIFLTADFRDRSLF